MAAGNSVVKKKLIELILAILQRKVKKQQKLKKNIEFHILLNEDKFLWILNRIMLFKTSQEGKLLEAGTLVLASREPLSIWSTQESGDSLPDTAS